MPLRGRRVVTTRETRSRLDSLLAAAGADVVHVPLIAVGDPDDGGAALRDALDRLDRYDWVVVTSRHGAARVGGAVASTDVGLGAVGVGTAAELARLAGRGVDVVPSKQTAAELVSAMRGRVGRVLVAQADRADDMLVDGLRAAGFDVDAVLAYATRLRRPTERERAAAMSADAVTFASGSAIDAWVDAIGQAAPPVVVAIGPTTAAAGERRGLKPTHVAADHDVAGLAAAVIEALSV